VSPARPRVVVTREADRAAGLMAALRRAGAEPVPVPVLRTEPPADGGRALSATLAAGRTDWLVLTSAEAAAAVARHGGYRGAVAVVGEATGRAAATTGLEVTLVSARADAASLAEALVQAGGSSALVAAADIARPLLAERLRTAGWRVEVVEAYRTVAVPPAGPVDAEAITYLSPSAVTAWLAGVSADGTPAIVATIGPTTSEAARAGGLEVACEARPRTVAGLVAVLAQAMGLGPHRRGTSAGSV
jgi:uroporphyrinogen-III synthase